MSDCVSVCGDQGMFSQEHSRAECSTDIPALLY